MLSGIGLWVLILLAQPIQGGQETDCELLSVSLARKTSSSLDPLTVASLSSPLCPAGSGKCRHSVGIVRCSWVSKCKGKWPQAGWVSLFRSIHSEHG